MRNPFTEEDLSGVVFFVIGMIILVFAGLFLGLVSDIGSKLSFEGSHGLKDENDRLNSRITKLETQIGVISRKHEAAARNLQQAAIAKELQQQAANAAKEADILREILKAGQSTAKLITEAKEAHRLQYREAVRSEAIGKTYDTITSRMGKDYYDVRVTDVTPMGVSISHRTGATRLGYRQMPMDWQKKLMFSAVEMAEAASVERKRQAVARTKIDLRVQEKYRAEKSESRTREIATLRSQIAVTTAKLAAAQLEAGLARNKVTYQESLRRSRTYSSSSYSYRYYNTSLGSYYVRSYRPRYRITTIGSKSVPGSLETWEQRAVRFERATVAYTAELASLRSRLASLDPGYMVPAQQVP
ncbi:MAG: hypothetical protein H7A51_03570 [Akkermansiaceae bacterium]|nr:hypothetical protein [Akkermansiaceae bacterium]